MKLFPVYSWKSLFQILLTWHWSHEVLCGMLHGSSVTWSALWIVGMAYAFCAHGTTWLRWYLEMHTFDCFWTNHSRSELINFKNSYQTFNFALEKSFIYLQVITQNILDNELFLGITILQLKYVFNDCFCRRFVHCSRLLFEILPVLKHQNFLEFICVRLNS